MSEQIGRLPWSAVASSKTAGAAPDYAEGLRLIWNETFTNDRAPQTQQLSSSKRRALGCGGWTAIVPVETMRAPEGKL